MKWRALKYALAFTIPLAVCFSFTRSGILSFLPIFYAFGIIPLAEGLFGMNSKNQDQLQSEILRKDRLYDILIWLTAPVQLSVLIFFLFTISKLDLDYITLMGHTASMGLMCGVFGINVAHELGHRTSVFEKTLSRTMLATSMYMHFYIEHNRGHHKNVGTSKDGASAKRGESVYRFWVRSIVQSFFSAWKIVVKERARKGLSKWSFTNEMIIYIIIELALSSSIAIFFSLKIMLLFWLASLIGILLLETVNYIEHYGLRRKRISEKRYEDVQPWHSWNSDFVLGRLFLFELTRHSDHHWQPSKHYQLLESMPSALQLPAGYPAMILLSLVPPIWFSTMDRLLVKADENRLLVKE